MTLYIVWNMKEIVSALLSRVAQRLNQPSKKNTKSLNLANICKNPQSFVQMFCFQKGYKTIRLSWGSTFCCCCCCCCFVWRNYKYWFKECLVLSGMVRGFHVVQRILQNCGQILTIGWRNFKCFGIINIVCTVRILNILWINTHAFSNYLFRIFLELFTMRHLF